MTSNNLTVKVSKKLKNVLLRQVSASLDALNKLLDVTIPKVGWVRTIRQALGMSTTQLGKRLGTSRQWVSELEKSEMLGTTTFKTMRDVASALDCEFVYFLVPRHSLEEMIDIQAEKLATKKLAYVAHSMGLEKQSVTQKEQQRQIKDLALELKTNKRNILWNDDEI